MSKTNDELRVTEDHRPLADSELDAVSSGWFVAYQKVVDQIITDNKDPEGKY